jgi:hypothetical protein
MTEPEYEMYIQISERLENATDEELDDILDEYRERRHRAAATE